MAKTKTIFTCQQCGAQRPRWEGKCSDCGAWNSFVEELSGSVNDSRRGWAVGAGPEGGTEGILAVGLDAQIVENGSGNRLSVGLSEMDRLLGGGLVSGSYTLVGGDPGIGKSTLLLQVAGGLSTRGQKVLYVSAEESVNQTAMRALRLGINSSQVKVASESRLDAILVLAQKEKPQVLIVDSIQTVYLSEVQSAPGSVSQVRECAGRLMMLAKNQGITVFVIGHVTKDGNLAGPRVLEHMVDTVLSFEGESAHHFRLLRALKNRFGATNELAVFEMSSDGLKEVANPSQFFLEEREGRQMGAAVFAALEGSRPLLCEIQALVSGSQLAMPRRTALGIDLGRVHLILAVLDKYLMADTAQNEVYVNVVGGLRVQEPASDLAVAAAVLSSGADVEISRRCCFFGELGLTGEVRAVTFAEERIREAEKLGFEEVILPEANRKHLAERLKSSKLKYHFVKTVRDLEIWLNQKPKPKAQASRPEERPGHFDKLV